jgi:hypothetical protein
VTQAAEDRQARAFGRSLEVQTDVFLCPLAMFYFLLRDHTNNAPGADL